MKHEIRNKFKRQSIYDYIFNPETYKNDCHRGHRAPLTHLSPSKNGKIVRYGGEKPPGSPNRIVKNMVMESDIMVMETEFLREVINILPVWKLKIFSNELNIPGKDVKKMIMDIELFQDEDWGFSFENTVAKK
jgi:hypothetical protein